MFFPMLVEFGGKDEPSADRMKIEVQTATPNVSVDASTFAFPGKR